MAAAVIHCLFIFSCVSQVLSTAASKKDYLYAVHLVGQTNLNEEDLALDVRTGLYLYYRVPTGQDSSFYKSIRSSTKVLGSLAFVYKDIKGHNKFVEPYYVWHSYSTLKLHCEPKFSENFPRDSMVCRSYILLSMKPVRCRQYKSKSYRQTGCTLIRRKELQSDPRWEITNIKHKWYNQTTHNFWSYEIQLHRRPYYYWIRITLPFGIIAAFSLAQLLIPLTRFERLVVNIFILLVMQNAFGSISIIPIIGIYGGGTRLGNLVTALLGINASLFVWSITARMLLSVMSATPLPHKWLGLIDWLFDKFDLVLLAPSLLVQHEESKAFTRRGDWFKLFLLIDRVFLLVGIVVTTVAFNKYYL